MIQAVATARYIRTSAQKAGLVLDLIRGKDVNRALATLTFARKSVAMDIAKVLRSAIANAKSTSSRRCRQRKSPAYLIHSRSCSKICCASKMA